LPTTGLRVANSGAPAAGASSRELRVAFTTLAALSRDDNTRWHLLATQRPASAPLTDAVWVRSWLEAFAPAEPVLLAARDGRHLVGLAALQRLAESRHGDRVTVLQSLTNEESFRFDFLSWQGRRDILEHMWRALCDTAGCDLIRIQHVPESSPTLQAALTVARECGWRALLRPTFVTPWRPLSRLAPWDENLTRKFKSNLRRRERRLEELGTLRCDVVRSGRALPGALEAFYRLEAQGWKGQNGTAVAQRPQVKAFYDRLVERAAADGGVWIPLLTLSENPIAAQVLRVSGPTMFGLKTAYDEGYAKYGPGQVLTSRVIRYGLDQGMAGLDLLAGNASYKADWAREVRPHCELLLFAPTLAGRCAYWTRYGVREQVKKLPGALRLARWLRTRSRAP